MDTLHLGIGHAAVYQPDGDVVLVPDYRLKASVLFHSAVNRLARNPRSSLHSL